MLLPAAAWLCAAAESCTCKLCVHHILIESDMKQTPFCRAAEAHHLTCRMHKLAHTEICTCHHWVVLCSRVTNGSKAALVMLASDSHIVLQTSKSSQHDLARNAADDTQQVVRYSRGNGFGCMVSTYSPRLSRAGKHLCIALQPVFCIHHLAAGGNECHLQSTLATFCPR